MSAESETNVAPSTAEASREEVFRRLFEEYSRRLYYFVRRRGFPSEECPDLTQETLFRVYKGWGGFRQEASVKTWLFKIAAHVGLNSLRDQRAAKRRGRLVPLDEVPEGFPEAGAPYVARRGLLDELHARELVGRVRSAMDELPPQMRRCVVMYVDQELKYREIAAAMNISEGAVKSQIHEARRRLKDRLGREFHVGGES
jgi:RNA polymerase sigma-70 factor (ECF subfamily)